jgi:hypothetical protein
MVAERDPVPLGDPGRRASLRLVDGRYPLLELNADASPLGSVDRSATRNTPGRPSRNAGSGTGAWATRSSARKPLAPTSSQMLRSVPSGA